MLSKMIVNDAKQRAAYSDEGPQPAILFENSHAKVIVGALQAGQQIPAHPEALAVYHFLEGEGWMVVDGQRTAVSPGTTIVTPQGSSRGVQTGDGPLSFLAVRVAQPGETGDRS